jgi:hypothetical protein
LNQAGDPAPKKTAAASPSAVNPPATGFGSVVVYIVMLIGGGAAFAAYKYLEAQQAKA